MKTKKLLVISGPTAVGKTRLALQLARKLKGEIVSADSRQVYQGMDIGTGKDVSNFKFQISNSIQISNFKFQIGYYLVDGEKIWMMDVVEPDYRFNVADYKKCADAILADIWKRGKLPIIVGGTGFYIKAITDGIGTIGVEPDWELRKRLSAKDIKILSAELQKLDGDRWEGMNESDRKNPRRLIRAIEIARKCKVQSAKRKTKAQSSKFDTFFIGLTAPNEILYLRIDQRVEERVKDGVEKEIKTLLEKGYNWDNSALGTTIAYKEWKKFFDAGVGAQHVAPAKNEIKEEIVQKWKFDEHNYARRQLTWFKKDRRINWFDITKSNWQQEVEKMVDNWYS